MRFVVVAWFALWLSLGLGTAHATTSKSTSKSATSSNAKPPAKAAKPSSANKAAKPAKSSGSAKATNKTGKTSKAATKSSAAADTCKPVKGKKTCSTGAAPKTYASPIASDSLDKKNAAQSGDELKARTVPDRAYAIDGQTFFHQGRRIRIEGLNSTSAAATGELAKQRLQTMLDSGNLSIDQIAIDDSGVATAQVRINGRDLASQLNAN